MRVASGGMEPEDSRDLPTEAEIEEALRVQQERGGALGRILVDLGFVREDESWWALGASLGADVVDLDRTAIPPEIVALVPREVARTYRVMPISCEDGVLRVAMADPLNVSVLDDLRFLLGPTLRGVSGAISDEAPVARALRRHYG